MNELILSPRLPERTKLFNLKPIGIGTADCESLYSWFLRLSELHCLLPNDLIRYVGESGKVTVSERTNHRSWTRHLHDSWFSGVGEHTQVWANVFQEHTKRNDLKFLTLLPWKGAFPKSSFGNAHRSWCAACLEEDRKAGAIYTRLAWDIGVAHACPKHGCKLQSVCPHCENGKIRKKRALRMAYHSPGYCAKCGEWLGADTVSVMAPPEEVIMAKMVGDLIGFMPSVGDITAPCIGPVLEEAAKRYFKGNSALLARWVGVSKSTLFGWQHGSSIPSIGNALNIAMRLSISLTALYLGNVKDLPPELPFTLKPPSPKLRTRARIDWSGVENKLMEYLEDTQAVSAKEASRRLGIAIRTLNSKYAFLMQQISRRYEGMTVSEYQAKKAACREALRNVVLELIDRNEQPFGRLARKTLEDRGMYIGWSEYREEFQKIASEIDFTLGVSLI